MGAVNPAGLPSPVRSRAHVWMVAATLIAVPAAFVGLVAIAPRMPPTTPGAPGPVFALPWGNRAANVVWRTPPNGGSQITSYRVTPYLGSLAQPGQNSLGSATNAVFTGLQNGMAYRFVVTAHNAIGRGQESPKTAAMIVGAPGEPLSPTMLRPTPGSLEARFSSPESNGAPITNFAVVCVSSNGGATGAAFGPTTRITVIGLTPGRLYTCAVKATNSRGSGPASRASEATHA